MGTRVSNPVGLTTSYGLMFETKLISIIGIYHSWDANISLFLRSQKNFTLQAHSWNFSTVQHFHVRTDLIAVTPSPHLTCMGLHRFQSSADSMTCGRENYLRMFSQDSIAQCQNHRHQVSSLLSAKIHGHQDFWLLSSKSMDTKTSDHLAWGWLRCILPWTYTPLL